MLKTSCLGPSVIAGHDRSAEAVPADRSRNIGRHRLVVHEHLLAHDLDQHLTEAAAPDAALHPGDAQGQRGCDRFVRRKVEVGSKRDICPCGLTHVQGVGLNGGMSEPGPRVQRPPRNGLGSGAAGDAVGGVAHVDSRARSVLHKKKKQLPFDPCARCRVNAVPRGVPADNSVMHPLLATALDEAKPLTESRGWARPTPSTLAEAERLLGLTSRHRPPTIQIDADGSIRLEWEAAETGWLTLTVDGSGQLRHSAVIGEDEFERSEAFGDVLPAWASTVLERLVQVGH